MTIDFNRYSRYLGISIVYFGFIFLTILLGKEFGLLNFSLNPIWDIEHYKWIKDNCYCDFRLVFFPGFPYLWKLTSLSFLGISILNGTLFIVSASYLGFLLNIHLSRYLAIISTTSSFFFFIPYTESLFYFFLSIGLIGIINNKKYHFFGFLFASLTRSASTILVASALMSFFNTKLKQGELIDSFNKKRIFEIILSAIFGLLIIGLINFLESGSPFSFYEYQKIWDNKIGLPTLPLRSWGSGIAHQLDYSALSIVLILIYVAVKQKSYLNPTFIFKYSFYYLLIFLALTVIFRGGSFHSFNRFIFCSPFYMVVIDYLFKDFKWSLKRTLEIFGILLLTSFLFGSFVHIQTFLLYFAAALYVLATLYIFSKNKLDLITIIYAIINVFGFIYLLELFYSGQWVG